MFLYLEVLDASFSFDGVIGAFAITNDIVLMALGLGIGAMYVRSLTVYLVRQGTLDDYVYLEHGAHYAIGALAVILLVTIQYEINEVITGLVGVVLIAWSFWSSVRRNKALAASPESDLGRQAGSLLRGVTRRVIEERSERGGSEVTGPRSRPAVVGGYESVGVRDGLPGDGLWRGGGRGGVRLGQRRRPTRSS